MEDKDIEERARAQAWLDMAQAKWRLQTMQHRSRYNPKTGEYRELPTRIRRFLNGTPVGMKTEVLAILKESAPYESPVFDCETDPGLKYRPTNTFIRKDGIEHTTNGKDPTYTIIQDLLLDDGTADAYMFGDESTCSQLGETEYHWDEADIVDCPDGGQGVSYQITDISRDRESDLFSYRVRKVQTLTTHMAPYVSECDARKRVTVEQWDGVYGEPGSFRYDPARGGSAPIVPPAPCDQPDGRSVRIEVYRNPDCTYRITVQTTYAVADDLAQYSVYKDQYKATDSAKSFNQRVPLPRQGVEYSNGVMTRYMSERNDDGTWNNTVETETERAVPNSTVERRQTPRGVFVSRVDTNQATAASGIQTPYGSYKSTKTPGGLFTNEYTEYTRSLVDNLGLTCSETLFLHTHETQSSVAAVPAAGTDVPAAAGGVVTTWTYDTDSEGFVTRRERTETEHRVDYAVKRKTNGYLGTATGYTHRSVPEAVADSIYDDSALGRSIEVRRTNGGLYDVEVQGFLRVTGRTLGLECSKTMYQHVHETAESAAAVGSHVAEAGGGLTYRRTYTVDPTNGAITVRAQTTQEILVSESRRSVRVTARGTTVQSTTSNSPTHQADASAAGASTEWEVTPGGRFNCTTVTTTPRQGSNGATCEKDAFLHSDGTTEMLAAAPVQHVEGGSGGTYRERTARLGDDGLWEVVTAVHQERENVDDGVDISVTARGMRKTVKTRQTLQPAEPQAGDAGKALRTSRTRGGLYNVEETTTTARPGPSAKECSRDLFLHSHSTGRTAAEADGEDVAPTTDDMTGVYRSRRQQLGDDGLWAITDATNTELSVSRQRVEERVTKHGLVRRTTDVQVTTEGAELQAAVGDIGKERVVEKTRGGRRNLTTTEVTPITGTTDESCEKTAFLHAHVSSETAASKSLTHVADAGNGDYGSETWTLTEAGTWERRTTENHELQPELKVQQYKDAFGETTVTEEFSNGSENGGRGGKTFTKFQLVRSVESTMTNGRNYNVRTKEETPTEVDSDWIHFEKTTDRGLAVYYDFIVFRNATKAQVLEWKRHAETGIKYTAGSGSFANHPQISIAPNKFELWDGTISVTTTFTPKEWASGGSTKDDNWETDEIEVLSVNFVPLNASKLLKIVTKEWHKKGGGVGKDKLEGVLEGALIKGSQFSFHPGGQVFSYDVVTKIETKGVVMDMPQQGTGGTGTTLWDGTMPQ